MIYYAISLFGVQNSAIVTLEIYIAMIRKRRKDMVFCCIRERFFVKLYNNYTWSRLSSKIQNQFSCIKLDFHNLAANGISDERLSEQVSALHRTVQLLV